jgi:hypothetical protein
MKISDTELENIVAELARPGASLMIFSDPQRRGWFRARLVVSSISSELGSEVGRGPSMVEALWNLDTLLGDRG